MTTISGVREMSRRELLASGTKAGAVLVVGAGFVAHSTEGWAKETKGLSPEAMATILQVARDTYPHDRLADKYYAIQGHDDRAAEDPAFAGMMERGARVLDRLAERRGFPSYVGTGWETDRTAMLRAIENHEFFQTIRGGLVVGLYNQKEVWGLFGYEGESFSQGGYIDRGFNDIDWL